MRRYGIFCFLGRGHLDPAIAIGRGLRARGHEVTIFHLTIAQAAVRAAGLEFHAIDQREGPPTPRTVTPHRWAPTVEAIDAHATRTLREGAEGLTSRRIDVMIADQLDIAAGTLAESLGLPFITMSCSPPIYLDDTVPPPYFGWQPTEDAAGRRRNARANALVERLISPAVDALNRHRMERRLPGIGCINDLFSKSAIISQLPRVLEFPRRTPPHLHYTAQFRDDCVEHNLRFDWSRLSGRPLVFASMGTVRNTCARVFRIIADACAQFNLQLVLSLGGGSLSPGKLGPVPGNCLVLHYAPQRMLLQRAAFAINCAGLNTTLECLRNGVPMIAIPAGEDQPGVAARIAMVNAGIVIPVETLSLNTLVRAVQETLANDRYRSAAAQIQQQIRHLNGVQEAVDHIERAA